MMNKVLNTRRNIIWGMFNQAVALGFPFIIRTVILRTLGTEYLGLNSLFTSIIQVLNLAELGFSSAIVYSLYKPIAEENTSEIRAILCFFRKIYRIIGSVIMLAGILLTPFLPHLINGNPPDHINIYLLFFMYLVNTSISYVLFSYEECILLAHQRNDLSSKRSIVIKCLLYLLQIAVLFGSHNYYVYVLIFPISTVVNNVLIHFTVKKHFPEYYAYGQLSSTIKNKIKEQVSGLIVIKLAAITRNSFDNIIMSSFLGLTIVGIYGNYYYIMSSVQVVMLILLNSIRAAIGNNIATRSVSENYLDFRRISFIYAWLSGAAAVCMIVFYQPFIVFWVGSDCLLSFQMVILLGLYFYLLTMGDVPNLYIDGTGIWGYYNTKSVVEAVSNLILNILLVKSLGIVGIVLATVLTRFLFGILWGNGLLFKHYFGSEKRMKYYADYFQYFLVVVISVILILTVNRVAGVSTTELSLMHILECAIVPNICYFILYRKTDRFAYLMDILNRLMRMKS